MSGGDLFGLDWLGWGLALLAVPMVLSGLDVAAALRARHTRPVATTSATSGDFEVLVPIYGSVRYLENVDYLSAYGAKVVLCTTTHETPEFYADLSDIADRHGFVVFRGHAPVTGSSSGGRATSGTIRDRLVRDALDRVTATYVVCLDADTESSRPLGELVGQLEARGLDLASVPLVPANPSNGLQRLQAHEYRAAMLLRRLVPWLVSGACHAARTTAHRDVMSRHSLFFQGNDVEVGVIAERLGYRVGHVLFDVRTSVPASVRPWLRQRLAWAGGETRLFLANPQVALRHPLLWLYGGLVAVLAFPLRWQSLTHATGALAVVALVYLALALHLHRGHWDRWLLLLPFYAAFSSLVLTPIGIAYYVRMALGDSNAGLIRIRRRSLVAVPATVGD